ncbi:MAG: PAS domain-containing protein [Paracoccus sp. (in: a-proteobacteria)]|nr:PAS domain-containing protein [Paracoccus sp. (in: a-proteobacteria)]
MRATEPWPLGDGEMTGMIRQHDWAATPLGPIPGWPLSLRLMVDLTLSSPVATILLWGPELIQIYNDPWRVIMGHKHPAALGQPTLECFPEITATMAPLYQRMWAGEGIVMENMLLPIRRNAQVRDAWWNVHYMPARDDQGGVAGIFCTVVETTQAIAAARERASAVAALKIDERRREFILALNDMLRPLDDPEDIKKTAIMALGQHLGVSRAHYIEVSDDTETLRLGPSYTDNLPPLPAELRLTAFGASGEQYRRGEVMVMNDRAAEPPDSRAAAAFGAIGAEASLGTPLLKEGRLVAIVSVCQSHAREWTGSEIALLRDVAERIWTMSQRAEAVSALRESETRYRTLFDLLNEGVMILEKLPLRSDGLRDYRYVAMNEASQRMFGTGDLTGQSLRDNFPAQDEGWYDLYDQALETGEVARFEREAILQGVVLQMYLARIDPPKGRLMVVMRDVTDATRAEEALRMSEERFRALATAGANMIYRMSPGWEVMYQLQGLDFLADTSAPSFDWWDVYILPEDRPTIAAAIGRAIRDKTLFEMEHRVRLVDGEIGWVRSRAIPILDEQGDIREWFGAGSDVTDRHLAEERLRTAEQRLRQFGEASPDVLWIRDAVTLAWTYLSPAFETIYGMPRERALAGDSFANWLDLILPEDRDGALTMIRRVTAGERTSFEYRITRQSDGRVRWLRDTDFPITDEFGRVISIGGIGHDITAEKETAAQMNVLVAELQHRTKNLMGVVRSITERTLRTSTDLAGFEERFMDRLAALARVQAMLSRLHEWERIDFDDLIRSEFAAFDGEGRVVLDGPPGILLRSSTVQTLGLALHELATNAMKYGALRTPEGKLAVRWRLERDAEDVRWLHVDWRESGAPIPPMAAFLPASGGLGRKLIEQALPYQLGARTTFDLLPEGLHCTVLLPVSDHVPPLQS